MATPHTSPPRVAARSLFGRVAGAASDLLVLAALVLAIPFVILAVAMPVVLVLRLVLWIVQAF